MFSLVRLNAPYGARCFLTGDWTKAAWGTVGGC